MAQRTRATLKGYFQTGDVPTQAQFADLIDSSPNLEDDGVPITSIAWTDVTDKPTTFAPATHNHSASSITSGTFANARISQGSVTQHQAALSITESQISDLGNYLTTVAWGDVTGKPDVVQSNTAGITGADQITNIVALTQAEYDAIGTPDASTWYAIVG